MGSKVTSLSLELEEAKAHLVKQQKTSEDLEIENKRLLAKANIEEEVVTLATSLQSEREEKRFLILWIL